MNKNNNNNRFEGHNTNDDQSQHAGIGRSLRDYLQSDWTTQSFCIIFFLNIGYFEIKSSVVQLLSKLHEMDIESPYLHLHEFEEVSIIINLKNISAEN